LSKDVSGFFNSIKNTHKLKKIKSSIIPTGLLPLDYVTGGGFKTGSVIRFWGAEQSGKTTAVLKFIPNMLKYFPDKGVIYFDFEHKFDESWAQKNGLTDNENFLLISPESGNQMMRIMNDALAQKMVSLIVVDSLASIPYEEQLDSPEKSYIGLSAKYQSQFFGRDLPHRLAIANSMMVVIDQRRANLSAYGASEKPYGSSAIEHIESHRIKVIKVQHKFDGKNIDKTQFVSKFRCEKAGTFMKGLEEEFIISPTKGVDLYINTANFLISHGILERKGAYYVINSETGEKVQGREKAIQYLLENKPALIKFYKDFIIQHREMFGILDHKILKLDMIDKVFEDLEYEAEETPEESSGKSTEENIFVINKKS